MKICLNTFKFCNIFKIKKVHNSLIFFSYHELSFAAHKIGKIIMYKIAEKISKLILVFYSITFSLIAIGAEIKSNPTTKLYAKEFKVSEEEAERRISIMSQSDYISEKIIEKFGEKDIAGVFFENEGNFKLVVRTTRQGQGSADILKFANQEFPDIDIEVKTNSPRNFRAIQNILKNQPQVLDKKIKGFQSLGYNPKEDKLIVGIYDPTLESSNEAIEKYKISKISGMDVGIRLLQQPMDLAYLLGGAKLSSGCTSGFSAYGADKSTKGIITAFHCTSNGTLKNYILTDQFGSTHSLVLENPLVTANQDIVFLKTTSNTVPFDAYYQQSKEPTIYYPDPVPIRTFGRKSELKVGESYACHEGITTGFSCGLIKDLDITFVSTATNPTNGVVSKRCNTTGPNCYHFVSVQSKDLKCQPGDSGGPITIGNAAHGIVSSCNYDKVPTGSTPTLYFSSLDYLNEFPVYLAVTPNFVWMP